MGSIPFPQKLFKKKFWLFLKKKKTNSNKKKLIFFFKQKKQNILFKEKISSFCFFCLKECQTKINFFKLWNKRNVCFFCFQLKAKKKK